MHYLIGAAAWLAVLGYFAWRIWICRQRLRYVTREITWVVWLVAALLVMLVWFLFPDLSQTGSAVVLIAAMVVSTVVSGALNRRFNAWIDEEQKRQREEERWGR